MTLVLTACFWLAFVLTVATCVLILAPATRIEIRVWRSLHVQSLRRYLTRGQPEKGPFDPVVTAQLARRNLFWHLALTGLFAFQLLVASVSKGSWWRPLAAPLILPCIAYFAGSLVQRQKMVLMHFLGLAPQRRCN